MRLTERQWQALRLLREGNTYVQAAAKMGLARSSVTGLVARAAKVNGFASTKDLRKAVQYMADLPKLKRRRPPLLGVYQMHTGKWKATISVHGRSVHINCFARAEEAAKARLEAEKKYRG